MGTDSGLFLCIFGVPAVIWLIVVFRHRPAERLTKRKITPIEMDKGN